MWTQSGCHGRLGMHVPRLVQQAQEQGAGILQGRLVKERNYRQPLLIPAVVKLQNVSVSFSSFTLEVIH